MTIKNKKTKESKASEVSSSSSSASTSVQKTSTSTSLQKSSNTTKKVSSAAGKKVRYIEVKVEEDDPLMITDVSDHASLSGSTISEYYNSHPHYIITEAPSINDLTQTRSLEHHQVSDMAQSTTGEFVSTSKLQESSTSHQQSSTSETFQRSSTSMQHSGSSHSQSFDKIVDSSSGNQTLDTGFLDNSIKNSDSTFLSRSRGADATNLLLQAERQDIKNTETSHKSDFMTKESTNLSGQKTVQYEKALHLNTSESPKRNQTVSSDSSKFFGGEGSLDKNVKTKEYHSATQTSESKSSSATKSSSSSYVVEIVDGKERIIDSSKREWGDSQEKSSKEAYASVSGTDITPQSVYNVHNYDMKSNYDTGKDGQKPTSELIVKEDSKLIKDNNLIATHSSTISEKDNSKLQQTSSIKDQIISQDRHQHSNVLDYSSNVNNKNRTIETVESSHGIAIDKRRNDNKTDTSNFYGYEDTIQNELKKVGDILQVGSTENKSISTKILKSNTSSSEQASTSSYAFKVVDGKERVVDSAHREWGDSKEHSTYEKSHNISGTGIKPEHEYTRHVLDKESYYDTGKDGVPKSSTKMSEESVLYKDGKEIASTSNTYASDYAKQKKINENVTDLHNKRIQDITDITDQSVTSQSITTDNESHIKNTSDTTTTTTDFLTTEKQNLVKETTAASTSQSKDTLTTYERSTGAWNGKFIYEKDDRKLQKPTEMSPFSKSGQPRHHLKRQDTEENIILSSRDIKDFTSISDLRKIIETSQSNKDITVNNKSIIINRNINDRVLKEIIETVKKYPFKRIEKVTFGTKINEDVKDLYEGIDTEETTVLNTSGAEITKKSFEVDKTKSQIEVIRYITENGVTRKVITYEDAKEDDKVKTNVFVDKSSSLDIKKLSDVHEYDVVDHTTIYDETITDDRKTIRDDRTTIDETIIIDETKSRSGPKKPERIVNKEQCICEICTCG